MKNSSYLFLIVLGFFCIFSACDLSSEKRQRIDLSGKWNFKLDPENLGENNILINDTIVLPGTTDTNQKGSKVEKQETSHLSRVFEYVGKAWYEKEIEIPESWIGKNIILNLERTKPTRLWINDIYVGSNDNISTPQVYDITAFALSGRNKIKLIVDNGESVPKQIISNSHAYTSSTQTNWNGIIGEIFIEARNPVFISDLRIIPEVEKKSIKVSFAIPPQKNAIKNLKLKLRAQSFNSKQKHSSKQQTFDLVSDTNHYEIEYPLGNDALLWSEFSPALYDLELLIPGYDKLNIHFGLREFKTKDTQFTINDKITFLRGKHDACVFPITAHTPMDLESWRDYFRICKTYGINHCRFHSWCPPSACFKAADMEGIYLQPELPFWGSLKREETQLIDFLLKEGINIQNEYGNHASFVLFALGNELSGDLDLMQEFTDKFREIDSRHLYAYGSNNFLGFKGQVPGEDFLVTCRVGGGERYETHTRGSFSFADALEGGYINNTYPNTQVNFSQAIQGCTVPVISHETGQFQVYPNFNEIEKYTGVLRPVNIEIFRDRLKNAGMLDRANDFFKASGRWSALLYKADIEMDLRTPGFGGFQLLDIQDYPGQGSAYVGILDAFMDNKGHIEAEEWLQFCNKVVPLFITEKLCWSNAEILTGEFKIANYSDENLKGKKLNWTLKNKSDEVITEGQHPLSIADNGLLSIAKLDYSLEQQKNPVQLTLELGISDTPYKNRYSLWIYPNEEIRKANTSIKVYHQVDKNLFDALQRGEKVLLFPDKSVYKNQTIGALFQTDYWNYRMFKGICERIGKSVSPGTLGILTDANHPLFNGFPTEYHTNWQWFSIIKESYPLILDQLPSDYRPLVQVIDNVERNHNLGLIFEMKVDKGKLLVCMSDLESAKGNPEVRSLYNSMIDYMMTEEFDPSFSLESKALFDLFYKSNSSVNIAGVRNISYEE